MDHAIETAVAVFASRSKREILEIRGTGNWGASRDRILQCRYVVAVRNRNESAPWQQDDFEHGTAFLVGHISGVSESGDTTIDGRPRYIIEFDAYAEVEVPNAWGKSRNPVWFTNLSNLRIDLGSLNFIPVDEDHLKPTLPSNRAAKDDQPTVMPAPGLSFSEARAGLAKRYGVSPGTVEITIRG